MIAVLQESFGSIQHGCQTSNGCTTMITQVQTMLMEAEEDVALVRLDISNAFSSVSRPALLALLKEELPQMPTASVQLLHAFLEHPMCVIAPPSLRHEVPAVWECRSGLAQGDPLSAALFCSCISLVLAKALRAIPHACGVSAYVDDAVLCVSYPALAEIWQPLQAALGQVVLTLNACKTQVWAPGNQRANTAAFAEHLGAEGRKEVCCCVVSPSPRLETTQTPYRVGKMTSCTASCLIEPMLWRRPSKTSCE